MENGSRVHQCNVTLRKQFIEPIVQLILSLSIFKIQRQGASIRARIPKPFKNSTPLSLAGDGDYKPLVSSEPDVTTVEMDGSEVSKMLPLNDNTYLNSIE